MLKHNLLAGPGADQVGSIRDIAEYNATTDTTTVTNHRKYDSFGNLESESDAAVDLIFGYTGRLFNEATGLQNNHHRWYDARIGQFVSEDPIGFDGDPSNLYRYVGNRPLALTDPTGLAPNDPPKAQPERADDGLSMQVIIRARPINDFGGAESQVKWVISDPTATGWVVQHVTVKRPNS